jgi:hypothetical protein
LQKIPVQLARQESIASFPDLIPQSVVGATRDREIATRRKFGCNRSTAPLRRSPPAPFTPARGPPVWEMLDQETVLDTAQSEPEYNFDQTLNG